MCERRIVATGVLVLVVAISQIESGRAQAPAQGDQGRGAGAQAGAPQGQGQGGAPRGQGAGAPAGGQGRGGPGGAGGAGAAGGRGRGNAYTPPPGSKELKDVLYNWAWHMGMLRSGAESELVKTLDYYGASGMFMVNGQPCTAVAGKIHMQVNYQLPGYRVQYECTLPNKQTVKNVETMSGDYAWDDDIPGAELVAGKGKSTPRPETLTERRIRLWASPHGAVKSAIAAAAGQSTSEAFGENPATLLDRQAAAGVKGTTTLTWEGEKAVLTFPVPDVPGATATATLTNYLADKVVVKNGADTTEFIYGKWADWNNPLFKIEALYAGTIVEQKNGKVVRNMTTKVTEIGQVYVIVPVPDSIKKAGK